MCVETEHLQVKLTMMVCPDRAYEMFTSSQTSVHSDSAFRKLAGATLISSCRPKPGTQNLLASAICFNFYCKLRLIWGLLIERTRVYQLNQLVRSDTDMRLQDGHGQLGPKER